MTVFTGSATGASAIYAEATTELARALAEQGVEIVYGGGHVGLMGTLADAALEAGGRVRGVMPQSLVDGEIAHPGLSELDIVADMHERKQRMAERAEAFIALPGGAGTLEEFFEVWTWQQLGLHRKPVALYDVNGFWQPLLSMIEHFVAEGFLAERYRQALIVVQTPAELLAALQQWAPAPAKW